MHAGSLKTDQTDISELILRRLLLMIPTILGIMLVSFVIVQFVPGGPVERMISTARSYIDAGTHWRIWWVYKHSSWLNVIIPEILGAITMAT